MPAFGIVFTSSDSDGDRRKPTVLLKDLFVFAGCRRLTTVTSYFVLREATHYNRDRRKPTVSPKDLFVFAGCRRLTTVTSYFVLREATHYNRDRRIPVLPELPKLVKRVRLPSVALIQGLPRAGLFYLAKLSMQRVIRIMAEPAPFKMYLHIERPSLLI